MRLVTIFEYLFLSVRSEDRGYFYVSEKVLKGKIEVLEAPMNFEEDLISGLPPTAALNILGNNCWEICASLPIVNKSHTLEYILILKRGIPVIDT